MQNFQKLTPVFVIGAMKAGTIFNSLRLNSEICFPIKKEPVIYIIRDGRAVAY